MKDAALIEEMNAFLNKTMEATEFMLTANLSRPEIVTPMREINAIIFAKNIVKFKRTLYSKEVSTERYTVSNLLLIFRCY